MWNYLLFAESKGWRGLIPPAECSGGREARERGRPVGWLVRSAGPRHRREQPSMADPNGNTQSQTSASRSRRPRLELRVGGKYRLGKKIGSGSFGDLYHGTSVQRRPRMRPRRVIYLYRDPYPHRGRVCC